MSEIDVKFFLALLAPTIGFAIWFGKRWVEDQREETRREKAQDNLVRALYAEIDFNTRDMEVFLEKSPAFDVLRQALQSDPDLVPHITDARHTGIYSNRISEVHSISDGALHQTIYFYGLLEKIRVQVEGINYPSYTTLSVDGRSNAVEVIRRTAQQAEICGKNLLLCYEVQYLKLGLQRFSRTDHVLSDEDLSKRFACFERNLQDARTRHHVEEWPKVKR